MFFAAMALENKIMVTVESNVPMAGRQNKKYPWASMSVGDSFVVPGENAKVAKYSLAQQQTRDGKTFKAGVDGSGAHRVWRTA